jgi:UDP-N-acetylglucosamine 1-carboxyvinyltransferase
MAKFRIKGNQFSKKGEIKVYGAKNSAIKLLPATLLLDGIITLNNIPDIEDIRDMIKILESLGAKVDKLAHHSYIIDTTFVSSNIIPAELAVKMRASFLFIAPLLIRFGEVVFPHPGGDAIGRRPIDMTLESLSLMGAEVVEGHNQYIFRLPNKSLKGIEYVFKWISHTATEHLIMAAVRAKGKTIIYNAALEPEIIALCDMLRLAGAKIEGDGTSEIIVEGVDVLYSKSLEYTNIPDRLEAGTFAILGALTRSDIKVTGIEPKHLQVFWKFLDLAGVKYDLGEDFVQIISHNKPYRGLQVKTHEYPGFVTDLQAPFTLLLTQAEGTSVVQETIFDGRLFYTDTLNQMGANIIMCDPYRVVVNGPTKLYGRKIESPDIRAGMTFLLASLISERDSIIDNIHHIDRGYEQIEKRLTQLGFDIIRSN